MLRTMTRVESSTHPTLGKKRAGVTYHVTRLCARAYPAPRPLTCGARRSTTSTYATRTKCAGAWITSPANPGSACLAEGSTLMARARVESGSTSLRTTEFECAPRYVYTTEATVLADRTSSYPHLQPKIITLPPLRLQQSLSQRVDTPFPPSNL